MSGVELIVAALAAGASAGITSATGGAVGDAYSGLKHLLVQRLADRERAAALDGQETDPKVWQVRLGPALVESGAAKDPKVLAAAQQVLDAFHHQGGAYVVTVDTNYGAAGTFNAPIAITNHPTRRPPARPGKA